MKNSSFWRLMGYLRNYRLNVVLSVLSNVLMALFTVASIPLLIPFLQVLFQTDIKTEVQPEWKLDASHIQAWLNYELSQLILLHGKEGALIIVCTIIPVIFFFKNLFAYLALFFMAPARNGIVRDVRTQLFDKLLQLPLGYFTEERKGDLMSRITSDVQEIEWSILNVLETVFREPIILLLSLGAMLAISPTLTGFVLILIVFTAGVIGGIGRTLKASSNAIQERLANLVTVVEEAITGLRIIKSFNAESYQNQKFHQENEGYRHSLTLLLWRRDLSSPLSEFLGIAVVAVLLWFGSHQVFSGQIQAATFISFLYAFFNVINPAKSFSRGMYDIQKGVAALQRVEQILDAPNLIEETPNALPIPSFQSSIEYRDVTFNYQEEEEPVLKNINLHIAKGEIVALVGASGAGKSTMADLLPRFFDITKGGIFIDGINIRNLKLHDLRNLMGIVSQEAILFNDTIYNNIVFGMPNVTAAEVEHAARIANAHSFIVATEQGYQTNIGDRGSKLSGGQRQRLTIARAILKNPPILILDEATSALDSESEKLVQDALLKLMQDRTSIIIAHRLSTIQHADKIIVMDQGEIIERGGHAELLAQGGEYRKLVDMQAF